MVSYFHPGYGGPRIALGSAGDGNVLASLRHHVLRGVKKHGYHCATQREKS